MIGRDLILGLVLTLVAIPFVELFSGEEVNFVASVGMYILCVLFTHLMWRMWK